MKKGLGRMKHCRQLQSEALRVILVVIRKPLSTLVVGNCDFDDGFPSVFQRNVVDVDVRGKEDLGIPGKALAGRKVRNLESGSAASSQCLGHYT